jgi:hypothetical protein
MAAGWCPMKIVTGRRCSVSILCRLPSRDARRIAIEKVHETAWPNVLVGAHHQVQAMWRKSLKISDF